MAPHHCSLAGAPPSLDWDSRFPVRRRRLMDSRRACSTLSSLAWNSPISSFILVKAAKAFSMSVSHTVVCVVADLVEASFFCFSRAWLVLDIFCQQLGKIYVSWRVSVNPLGAGYKNVHFEIKFCIGYKLATFWE